MPRYAVFIHDLAANLGDKFEEMCFITAVGPVPALRKHPMYTINEDNYDNGLIELANEKGIDTEDLTIEQVAEEMADWGLIVAVAEVPEAVQS